MEKSESPWNKDGDWKTRYTRLYTSNRLSIPNKEEYLQRPERISFLSDDSTPYTNLLVRVRNQSHDSGASAEQPEGTRLSECILSPRSDVFSSLRASICQSSNLGGNDIKLLKMVRERSRDQQAQVERNPPLEIPKDETDDDDEYDEACIHGLGMRVTERSVSRSRISRMSTRRDMDIPSILAYNTSTPPPPTHVGIPAFQNVSNSEQNEVRWSIRRFMCPVCSQKWKDKSSVHIVKNSGLKKNSSQDIPSVKASAKLRTSITLGYTPRPALAAVDEDAGMASGIFRSNSSASWQLTRARRFRPPKLQQPSPEAIAPPIAAAPLARKDLDLRVNRFLSETVPLESK